MPKDRHPSSPRAGQVGKGEQMVVVVEEETLEWVLGKCERMGTVEEAVVTERKVLPDVEARARRIV